LNKTLDATIEECYQVQHVELLPNSARGVDKAWLGPSTQTGLPADQFEDPSTWYHSYNTRMSDGRPTSYGSDTAQDASRPAVRPSTALRYTQKQIAEIRAAFGGL
jgi:hypothetical protein